MGPNGNGFPPPCAYLLPVYPTAFCVFQLLPDVLFIISPLFFLLLLCLTVAAKIKHLVSFFNCIYLFCAFLDRHLTHLISEKSQNNRSKDDKIPQNLTRAMPHKIALQRIKLSLETHLEERTDRN